LFFFFGLCNHTDKLFEKYFFLNDLPTIFTYLTYIQNNTVIMIDNTVTMTDNTVTITDNTVIMTDNTVTMTDNTVTMTDNTVTMCYCYPGILAWYCYFLVV